MASTESLVRAVTDWPARYFFAIAVAASILLTAMNSRWAAHLGTAHAPTWLRLGLFATILLSTVIALTKSWSIITQSLVKRRRKRAFMQQMSSFTAGERRVLSRFVHARTRTSAFLLAAGSDADAIIAADLAKRGHLYQVAQHNTAFFTEVHYGIQTYVFEYLTSNPHLLDDPEAATGSDAESLAP